MPTEVELDPPSFFARHLMQIQFWTILVDKFD
jgi:hypothetical protein